MVSFVYSAWNYFMDSLQGMGYFDMNEISQINAKYIPGLELQFTSEYLQKMYSPDSIESTTYNKEIGILYKLKYGEIGALRVSSPHSGFKLTSMGIVDVNIHKLKDWNVGFEAIAGNGSAQIKLDAEKYVLLARHRIHPRFVALAEFNRPFVKPSQRSTFAWGFECEFNSRTTLEWMFSSRHPATFALQYKLSKPQCLLRVSGDVYSNRIGVSLAFHPSSVF